MISHIVKGFFKVLFRVWTVGMFYFLNTRLFSWIKDTRLGPKLCYQKMAQLPKKDNLYTGSDSFELCLLSSRHYSWKHFVFMNLSHSQNHKFSWNSSTAMHFMDQKDKIFYSVTNSKKAFSMPELFSSRSKLSPPQQEAFNKKSCKDSLMCYPSYSTGPACLYPYHYNSMNLEFVDCNTCEDYSPNSIYNQEQDAFKEMDAVKKEMLMFSSEKKYNRAESIDSGFQSFHNVNIEHTCINTNGIVLYISDICYNKNGKLIAMKVGFGVEEDSSEESIFSDDEEDKDSDDELLSDEEDFDSEEEDFIVFDTTDCEETKQFRPSSFNVAVTLDAMCPKVELQISQTFSPKLMSPCAPKPKHQTNSFRCKKEKKVICPKDVDVENKNEITNLKTEETCSAGATENPRRKVHFSSNVELHNIVTWDFAYRQARVGPWKDFATDRVHFQRRIDEIASILEPVLLKKIAQMAN